MLLHSNYSLLPHNTFGIPCQARIFAEYDSPEELVQLLAQHLHERILHIGGGSNLLFLCDEFHGMVLHSRIVSITPIGETYDEVMVRVGGGMVWDNFVQHAINSGWSGAENLSFIPGEVGASAVQNIGAYGAEACGIIESVDCVHLPSGRRQVFTREECNYGYRSSLFKSSSEQGQWAVVHVTFRLQKRFVPIITHEGLRREIARREWAEESLTPQQMREAVGAVRHGRLPDPAEFGNAGSFFKNPIVPRYQLANMLAVHPDMPHYDAEHGKAKLSAAWLIDRCGWKGRSMGSVAVYDKSPLVIVNTGGASSKDVLALCNAVKADVEKTFGVRLEPEVNFIS